MQYDRDVDGGKGDLANERGLAADPRFDRKDAGASFDALIAEARGQYDAARKAVDGAENKASGPHEGFVDRMAPARKARCHTAYCSGGTDGTKYGVEPMLDLPIGASVSFGDSGLGAFANSADLSISFTAGVRFWMFYDLVSLSMFFGKPVFNGRSTIQLSGSGYEHPVSSIRRIGPSFALGLANDIVFIGGGYDVLINGSGTSRDLNFGPNEVLSRALTLTLGLAPFTAVRNVMGGSK
ncbi:MAG TPA: hypothetical protein PLR99_10220 [Polyangiaceae bacterium]|nr:hypothetical protein [Polyangiaceae bacterium]